MRINCLEQNGTGRPQSLLHPAFLKLPEPHTSHQALKGSESFRMLSNNTVSFPTKTIRTKTVLVLSEHFGWTCSRHCLGAIASPSVAVGLPLPGFLVFCSPPLAITQCGLHLPTLRIQPHLGRSIDVTSVHWRNITSAKQRGAD